MSGEATFTIPGPPVPAVRMTQKSKHKNPQAKRYLAYKQAVGWAAKAAGIEPIEGPVIVNIDVYLKDRMKRRWDIDNVAKAVLDGCNKVCFLDDKQVTRLKIQILSAPEVSSILQSFGKTPPADEWTTVTLSDYEYEQEPR